MSRADEIIRRGDPMEILRMGLGARFAAEEGRFCECDEPALTGRDLMCGNCLLENEGQIARLEALIRGSHAFEDAREGSGARRLDYCAVCAFPRDDPRHEKATM